MLKNKSKGIDNAKKANGTTDENLTLTIVEEFSFQDILTSYSDFYAGDATLSAVSCE